MGTMPSYDELLAAMKRIADPDDECHCGTSGPWQELAQTVLFGRPVRDGGEWYDENSDQRLTVDEMIEKSRSNAA